MTVCRNRPLLCFLLAIASAVVTPVCGEEASHALVKQFPYSSHVLADPIRPRVYATLFSSNSVLVIDTDTLQSRTIPIGTEPLGLALSPDNNRLYVANSGSTTAAIGVLDLNTLEPLTPIAAPASPGNIAVASDGICYLSTSPYGLNGGFLMRTDPATGNATKFALGTNAGALLKTHPVQPILYVAAGPTLYSYDISGVTPALLQNSNIGSGANLALEISHNGQFLAAPTKVGNDPLYTTRIIPASDINATLGTLQVGTFCHAIAFSNDDQVAYQASEGELHLASGSGVMVQKFDLNTFARTQLIHSQVFGYAVQINSLTLDHAGKYLFAAIVRAPITTQPSGLFVYSLRPASPNSYPLNLSTRARIDTGDDVLIAGLIIRGGATKKLAFRALGPSLVNQDINGPLSDPMIELYHADGAMLGRSNNYGDDGEPGLPPALIPPDPREAALVRTLEGGNYTVVVKKGGSSTKPGIGIVEIYDLDPQPASNRMVNVSSRGFIGASEGVMIAGVISGGNDLPSTFVVRAVGPSLSTSGITNSLQDPMLEIHDRDGALVAANDDWSSSDEPGLAEAGLVPADAREAAVVLSLPAGPYTAIVRGKNNGVGVGLVEVYNVDAY